MMLFLGALSTVSYIYAALRHEWTGIYVYGVMTVLSMLKYAWRPPRFAPHLIAILDHDRLNAWRKLEAPEFQSIVENYRSITPRMMRELEQSIFHKKFDETRRLARRLHGSSMSMGALRFARIAQCIMDAAQMKDELRLPLLMAELYAAYPDIDAALGTVGAEA